MMIEIEDLFSGWIAIRDKRKKKKLSGKHSVFRNRNLAKCIFINLVLLSIFGTGIYKNKATI